MLHNPIEGISLLDILAQPTQERQVNETVVNEDIFQGNPNFLPKTEVPEVVAPPADEEPEEPYDAEKEARTLVNMLNGGNILVLTPIAHMTVTKKRGGKSAIQEMKKPLAKRQQGQKLTEDEEKQLEQFHQYKADLALINGEIPYTKEQKEMLYEAALSFCEETRFKAPKAAGFWLTLSGLEITKVMSILNA